MFLTADNIVQPLRTSPSGGLPKQPLRFLAQKAEALHPFRSF
jgi:hypothetical protein